MFKRRLLGLLLALGIAAPAWAADPVCVLTQRWNEDPPFSMKTADGQIVGVYVDLAAAALARMGCTAKLMEMPWARALAELKAGKLDILPGTLRNPERQAFAYFVAGRWYSRNLLFAHVATKELWPKASLEEIRRNGFRLGAQIGVSYGPEFLALDREPDFHAQLALSGSRQALWKMIELRRIDGLIADEWTARYELAQLGLSATIRATPLVVSDEAASFAFSKATVQPEFVERFEAALDAMLKDGSYAAIVRKYVPEATPPKR